jgi:hypothetical protein
MIKKPVVSGSFSLCVAVSNNLLLLSELYFTLCSLFSVLSPKDQRKEVIYD